MITLKEPKTEEDFSKYYDLRWKILRKPWNQPKGSEKDNLESESIHVMALEDKIVLGVGRGHFNSPNEAQIRYMAVEENQQGKGIGKIILMEIEKRLKEMGARYIVLNSRESARDFYKKQGYETIERIADFLGIPHYKMKKEIK